MQQFGDQADLEAYFGQFGELEDVYIHANRKAPES